MDHSARVYDDITQMLPDEENPSPIVRLNRLVPEGSQLWAKLEWMNPFGSVKDRAAWFMLRDLERRGELGPGKPGRGIVEPTSGNTGLSLTGHRRRARLPDAGGGSLEGPRGEEGAPPGLRGQGGGGARRALPTARKRGRHHRSGQDARQGLGGPLRDAQPVRQPAERRGARPHHRPGDLAADAREGDPRLHLARHLRHGDGAQQVPEGEEPGGEGHRRAAQPGARRARTSATSPSSTSRSSTTRSWWTRSWRSTSGSRTPWPPSWPATRACAPAPAPGSSSREPGASPVKAPVPCGVMIFCDDVFKYASNMLKHVPGLKAEP